jgi:hypothetical protein
MKHIFTKTLRRRLENTREVSRSIRYLPATLLTDLTYVNVCIKWHGPTFSYFSQKPAVGRPLVRNAPCGPTRLIRGTKLKKLGAGGLPSCRQIQKLYYQYVELLCTQINGPMTNTLRQGWPTRDPSSKILASLKQLNTFNNKICPDRPWGPPSLLYNGYRVFPGGKAAGEWRWPPTPI